MFVGANIVSQKFHNFNGNSGNIIETCYVALFPSIFLWLICFESKNYLYRNYLNFLESIFRFGCLIVF